MHVCMHVCIFLWMCACIFVCYVCIFVCMHLCIYIDVCMYMFCSSVLLSYVFSFSVLTGLVFFCFSLHDTRCCTVSLRFVFFFVTPLRLIFSRLAILFSRASRLILFLRASSHSVFRQTSLPSFCALDDIPHLPFVLEFHPSYLVSRARYKRTQDPTVEDVRKLCTSTRKLAKGERALIHYNGHGVPRPTPNGEIWVFNEVRYSYR